MKAITFEEHGDIDKLKYTTVPDPEISANDVIIKVKASGVNYTDIWARRGLPGMKISLPHISGSDVSGVVQEVGSEVKHIEPGQNVLIHPSISCRICEYCCSGKEYFCRNFQIYGFQTGPLIGGHAELCKISGANVIPMPSNLTFEEAASLPLVLLTVWHMLVSRANISSKDTVLIWGAGGGLGTIAIQVSKLFGAKVIAVVGNDEKLKKAKELGADEVINHKEEDVSKSVKQHTQKKGVDIVFEHVGESTWETSIKSLRWGGKLVICGATTGYNASTDLRYLWNKQLNLLGCHMGSKFELIEALNFIEKGNIKPVVGKTLPLEQAGIAQKLMESREIIGKIVLMR